MTGTCEVCGNEYDKAFEISLGGKRHVFDSFECAIQALAPRCAHCGCRVIGHGTEADGRIFCCAHCAQTQGARDVADRGGAAAHAPQH
jgi:Rieske Fe-S protein